MDARLALIGLVVGVLVGISGVGGSSLMTPLLILVLRVNPLVAVGTDLAYSVPTKLLGALIHWRQGTVDRRLVAALCLGGLPGALLGLGLLVGLRAWLGLAALNGAIKHGVGALLLLTALAIVLTPLLARRHRGTHPHPAPRPAAAATSPASAGGAFPSPAAAGWTPATRRRAVALGAVVGVLVSLTSIGSGAVAVPALVLLLPRLGLRRVVGSDVAFAAGLIPLAAAGHAGLGSVDVGLAANLLLGSLPGVFVGSKLCAGLPESWLRPVVAGTMLWAGASLV